MKDGGRAPSDARARARHGSEPGMREFVRSSASGPSARSGSGRSFRFTSGFPRAEDSGNKVGGAPKGLIQRCGSGVKCGRSRGADVSVDISPFISTCGRERTEDRGRPDQKPGRRRGSSSFLSVVPDEQQEWMFSYISAENRVPKDHPLRSVRTVGICGHPLSILHKMGEAAGGRCHGDANNPCHGSWKD